MQDPVPGDEVGLVEMDALARFLGQRRRQMAANEFAHLFAEGAFLGREFEIHGVFSL